MNAEELYRRYQQLQAYVGWTDADAGRVAALRPQVEPLLPPLIDDFYAEIERHAETRRVITGGAEQIARLKGTLLQWIRELFSGNYDRDYVGRRWRVGWRHVDIGLDQRYTNAALSRLRGGLVRAVQQTWAGTVADRQEAVRSLDRLLDLDLAIIEDAYQAESADRLQHAERLLARERSEAAFETLVEAAPCLIVILRPDRTVAFFSRYAARVTGHDGAAALGQNFTARFLPPETQAAAAEQIAAAFAGKPMRGAEGRLLCQDGGEHWVLWNAQRLPEYEGAPAVLLVGQDITTLKRAQEQALQSERLAAIGQMMAGLAHESGNALARSQACLEMLALEVPDKPEVTELIGRIQLAQNHLQQLYQEVRNYAAPLKLEREPLGVDWVWRSAWKHLTQTQPHRRAELGEHAAGVDLECAIDPFRVEQVFRNIFENSLAACADPVRIEVHCTAAALDGRPALRVAVRDNGPGLSGEQRRRIFEPFFTTKTKGTGLGMAIAKRIVEAHGGRIVVGSAAWPGAEIVLTLPRAAP
jgi:PAS domain S-box-containing protein